MDAAKKYEYIKTLGEGSYGHVWLCRDRERDCLVAIKKFKDANKDSQAYHLAMREIKLLRATTHEHVVSVIEAFRSQSSGNVYLVMEYADSCLNLELKKHRTGLPPPDVVRITWQLASALQYLHSRKIIHRDLKPANILLTAAGDLKLCDFGFARDLPAPGQAADMSSYVTTRWYRAPEVVVGADYGAAVDIWALGCLFAELLNGQPLFPGASNMDQLALIVACFGHLPNRLLAKALTNPHLVGVQLRTGNPRNWAVALQQRFAPYGEAAVTLLLACLNPDPLKRATADEVMRMAYFETFRAKRAASQPAAAASETPSAATPAAPATAAAAPVANGAAAEAKEVARREPSATPEPKRPVLVAEPQPERPAVRKAEEQPAAPAAPAAAVAPAPAVAAAAAGAPAAVAPSAVSIPAGTPPPSEPASVRMGSGSLATAGSGASSMDLDGSGPVPAAAAAAGAPVVASVAAGPVAAIRSGIPSVVKMHSEPHLRVEPQPAPPKPAFAPPAAAAMAAPAPAPAVPSSALQEAAQAGTTAAPAPAPAALAPAAAAAVSAAPQASQPVLQPQPPVSVQPVRASNSMRASSSNIPLPTGAPLVRPTTDSGAAHLQDGQVPPVQGKAGSTLAQQKRASEANLGYGSQRGAGATADVPVRIARVSMINPGGEAVQHGGNAATTPTSSAAVAGGAGAISPAGSFGGASSGMGRAPNHRRRSTATGSRLTRMSHTCEGQDSLLREEDSEEDTSAGKLPTVGGSMVSRLSSSGASGTSGRPSGSRASPGLHLQLQSEQQGPAVAAQHPSPRRYSRLSSVTEPGAQQPAGMDAAGGGAAEAAAGQGGLHSHPHTGRAPLQAHSPLGRQAQWSTSGVAGTPSLPAAAAASHAAAVAAAATAAAAAHSAAAAAASHGHQGQPHGPGAGHHPGSIHPGMHSVASAAVLNVSGPERNGGEILRSNVQHNIPTPAAPTAAMRSFTSAHVSTPAAAAAAAGLMSRPVSNLYINVDQGKGMDGSSSAESSPRSGGTTPSGNVAMPPPNAGRRQGIAEGPNSIFRSMLRSLSTRRTSGASVSSNASGEQHSGTPTAAGGIPAQQGSIGGAPTGGPSGHPGVGPGGVPLNPAMMLMGGHSQSSMGSSAGVSPFIPSRASSNNFIAGGPAGSADSSSSTASLTAPGGAVHGDGAQGHMQGGGGAGLPVPGARRSMTGTGHGAARIGLPQLSVHANGVSGGAGAGINGYGSAVVSPAGRRRGAEVAQPMRMSDAGVNAGSHSVLAMAASLKQAVGMQQAVEAVPVVEAGGGHGHVGMRPMPPTDGAPGRLVQNSRSMREHGQ